MELLQLIHISLIIVAGFANFAFASECQQADSKNGGPKMSSPEECARECVEGDEPKTCYYHFTLEYYMTMSDACKLCHTNSTDFLRADCQCIEADGYERSGLVVANRMHPGPAIQVCLYDLVVVDVSNQIPGNEITLHWHGIYQQGYQQYDGVPFVTQCPIQEGSTFRYQWRANNAGTHFWHGHTGFHKQEGADGAIIVRTPRSVEPNTQYWDYDNFNNIIMISDWLHDSASDHYPGNLVRRPGQRPDNFLINGMGRYTDPVSGNTTNVTLTEFRVQKGNRYRFRMINACALTCPVMLSIEGHNLTVIGTDGENIEPVVVDSIVSLSAERYDFVINADKEARNYWIQLRGLGECERRQIQQFGILRYTDAKKNVQSSSPPSYSSGVKPGLVLNQLNVQCNDKKRHPNTVCVSDLKNAGPVNINVIKAEPDVRLYFPINFHTHPPNVAFRPGTYPRFLVAGGSEVIGMVANISNVFPASPLLTQREDIPDEQICSVSNLPDRCQNQDYCNCTHIEKIPQDAIVEIILVDEARIPGMSHPFHLHGNAFYVIGQGCGSEYNVTKMDVAIAKKLDLDGRMIRHLSRPALKDTYAVPNNGFTIIRMHANNPGYWLFHCHFLYHLTVGMSLVFHVGSDGDLPPTPQHFPKCGNFMPPINEHPPLKRNDILKSKKKKTNDEEFDFLAWPPYRSRSFYTEV